MPSFSFNSIIRDKEIVFSNKLFLWIWHADKIPPHIGISQNDKYFSLKVSGKDDGLDCSKALAIANSKKISLVLIEIKKQININIDKIASEFDQYQHAEVGFSTCLTPITKILNHTNARQLSELLTLCDKENEISAIYGLHLPANYSRLESYSNQDIQKRLQLLTDENRKINIS